MYTRNRDLDPKEVRYGVVYRVDMLAEVTNLGEAAYQSIMKLNFTSDLLVVGVEINSVWVPFVLLICSKVNSSVYFCVPC